MRHPTVGFLLTLVLAIFLQPAACSFSLDTVVKDWWYYVHNHLADTTSQACLDAYSTTINCDMTLLGLVSSGSPNFDPGPADFERTCVKSCADSLEAWVQNVKQVCVQEGDAALVYDNVRPYPRVPVAVVGEVFQYEYAFACSKNSSGWCELNYPSSPEWARTDFTCTNECAVQFFTNAHNLPGSNYWFGGYELGSRSDWWKTQWAEGWDHVLECRSEGTSTRYSSSVVTTSSTVTTTSSMSTTSADSTSTDDIETVSSTRSSSRQSTTPSPTSLASSFPTPSSNQAGRLRPPIAFRALAWI
ncbi:hypothetical protein F5Y19DRAFT_476082 [Xylariaceae sp. FL1651]|nr:hypothetical protein F5Y19DRAFT_476082 [Xylariaceae sp. FL1651]